MKKRIVSLFAAAAALVACSEQPEVITPAAVSIEPVITRALSLNFQDGNKIGLDIVKNDEAKTVFAENAMLTYAGTSFVKEDLNWYPDGGTTCTLSAYYPYQEAGFPETFTIATDQSAGTESSDFMVATKTEVRPSASPIVMNFKHQFSQIQVVVTNTADIPVESISLKGVLPTANVTVTDGVVSVEADATADKVTVLAEPLEANKKYAAIIVPQTIASLGVIVKIQDGASLISGITDAVLQPGYTYTIAVEILASEVTAKIAGEIDAWEDGGVLNGGDYAPSFEEFDGYFIYDDVRYNTVTLADGRTWMAQNLAYVPFGMTPSKSLSEVTAGIYYPVVYNETTAAAEFSDSPEAIRANGYLYQSETALGVKVGSLKTVAEAEALAGAQGICPPGWHIPTIEEYVALIGKALSPISTNTGAPYYDKATSNGSIALLNAAGFNIDAYGAVSIGDNTKTAATLSGKLNDYTKISSGFICGSSYKGVTYNTSGDETSGIKNIQFWGLMPMTNKESEAAYTCNGSGLGYRIGASVRCIKNATVTE